ncbi:MAG: hypothetical protein US68_C0007G0031 [Candidatus Shapirobacteria bacterium GW2011_GWE1_38_10]|uniref:Uncharacterized protein n=1 Tax=Candidatus Shapirobacteria bacterium GW2011_GWE1_38_10 TaxID=1618488 RepID=A0A0G0I4M8_9BACT|nr:MAG: hypothetical protein US46_C0007G0023 [Candidatus Shapirobacteria bacterium GW2011_GWF2_37_20]KKQ50268.1 MAG: hypothetical protein US68_C0007G0031 [Candidatus Shapirobacteria bacterium GW2011_GWE1_38_10]KKQ64802.1 MAG: hypothetical protein US85_C0003G0024 [Candidatus Shapirobacteria bacterium GW2011_GWF1_38_23]HBP51329.1 hypothetical protein [Candidatus Shapirobacteria bacterium]
MSHFKPEFETLIVPGFKPLIINNGNEEGASTTDKNPQKTVIETRVFTQAFTKNSENKTIPTMQ